MATTIIQRTISAVLDNAIQLSNSQFGRPVNLSTAWNKIRVGIRWHTTDSGANLTGTPKFALGFCHGTSKMFASPACVHFVGALFTAVNWTRNATSYSWGSVAVSGATKIGSTIATSTDLVTSLTSAVGNGAASGVADRTVFFCDILKGSPNYTFYAFINTLALNPADVTKSIFLAQMLTDIPVITNNQYSASPQTLAVDEAANGYLDTVNCSWDQSAAAIEISDLAVAVLS